MVHPMLTPVVTAANRKYWPGLRALYNSFRRHCGEDFEFWAIVAGDESFVGDVRELGVKVIANPIFPPVRLPIIAGRPKTDLAMYYQRLLIPGLFADRPRSIYVDADSIILQSLSPLARDFGKPVAATRMKYSLRTEINGADVPDRPGFMSSLMVMEHARWRDARIFERCLDLMNGQPDKFRGGDQSVLNWALLNNWHELPWETQAHAGQETLENYPRERIFTLHFLGTNPWEPIPAHLQPYPDYKVRARTLWQTYDV